MMLGEGNVVQKPESILITVQEIEDHLKLTNPKNMVIDPVKPDMKEPLTNDPITPYWNGEENIDPFSGFPMKVSKYTPEDNLEDRENVRKSQKKALIKFNEEHPRLEEGLNL